MIYLTEYLYYKYIIYVYDYYSEKNGRCYLIFVLNYLILYLINNFILYNFNSIYFVYFKISIVLLILFFIYPTYFLLSSNFYVKREKKSMFFFIIDYVIIRPKYF